jgi:hypothetical protein
MNRIVRVCTAAVAATLLVVLAGCTPTEDNATTTIPVGGSHGAPDSAPNATATDAPVAAEQPVGACDQLLDVAELAADLGGGKHTSVEAGDLLIAVVGGIDCRYYFSDPGSGADSEDYIEPPGSGTVYVTVAPKDIVNSRERDASLTEVTCSTSEQDTDLWRGDCGQTGTVSGWWYHLGVHTVTPLPELRASFTAVSARLVAALSATGAPAPSKFVPPFDCRSADAGGQPVGTIERDASSESEIFVAASLLAGPVGCAYTVGKDQWTLTVYPGGAHAYDQCTRASWPADGRGETLTVPEVKAVFAYPDQSSDYAPEACATDGVNLIFVSRDWQMDGGDPMRSPASVTTLRTLLVPVFAAITSFSVPLSSAWDPPASKGVVAPLAGGDCKKLLNIAPIKANLGTASVSHIGSGDEAFSTVGGLDCSYFTGGFNEGNGGEIDVTVAPRSIAHPDVVAATLSIEDCAPSDGYCHTISTAGDWWYSLSVYGVKTAKKTKSAYLTLKTQLVATLTATRAPDAVGVKKPFDCSAVDIAGLTVDASRRVGRNSFGGPISGAVLLFAGPSVCTFREKNGDAWEAKVYPGTTVAYDQCTQTTWMGGKDGKVIAVPGVNAAFALQSMDSGSFMCASDGSSSIVAFSEGNYNWTAKVRKKLGALLVPIFAAAAAK